MPFLPKNMDEIRNNPPPKTLSDARDLISILLEYNSKVEDDMRLLKEKLFGRKSERYVNPDQPAMFDEIESEYHPPEEDGDDDIEVPAHRRKKRKSQISLPKDLERETRIHELSGRDRECSCCGKPMIEIGEDKTEKLDVIPASAKVVEDIYKKYACANSNCDTKPAQSPRVPVAIPKIKATEGTLAFIAVQKYLYALPLYRLETFFSGIDVPLSRSVMSQWMIKLADALKPIYLSLEEQLLAGGYIHMDETRVQVLKEPGRAATSKSYMWVRTTDIFNPHKIALFNYDPHRNAKVAEELLRGFSGYLQTDDYSAYPSAIVGKEITHLLCWDHARRYFSDAYKAIAEKNREGTTADQVLKLIQKLYKIERRIKDLSHADRALERQKESLPTLEKILNLCELKLPTLSRSSKTAKAINYMLDNWEQLLLYTTDGVLNISNSPAEQKIRPFAIGRKNWLFSDSQNGADASAILYSIIQTAKLNGLDPYTYIKTTLQKIPLIQATEDLKGLMPFEQELVH